MKVRLSILLLLLLGWGGLSLRAQGKKDQGEKADTLAVFDSVIKNPTLADSGLFNVYLVGEDYFFELPDTLLEQEILIVSRMSGTIDGLTFGGAGMKTRPQQVIRWQRHQNK
ncbi:MAG: DUF5118 domain-containing protein, partial [Bacteroidetes bacterium]